MTSTDLERMKELARDESIGAGPKHPGPPSVDNTSQIEKMNSMSYEELTTSKKTFQEGMREASLQNIKKMSPAVRKSYFEELVEIANCAGFTPMGISPDQAVVELNRLLGLPEFSFVSEQYPKAKEKIEERYLGIISNRINI